MAVCYFPEPSKNILFMCYYYWVDIKPPYILITYAITLTLWLEHLDFIKLKQYKASQQKQPVSPKWSLKESFDKEKKTLLTVLRPSSKTSNVIPLRCWFHFVWFIQNASSGCFSGRCPYSWPLALFFKFKLERLQRYSNISEDTWALGLPTSR